MESHLTFAEGISTRRYARRMKASITFREARQPVVRAKVHVSILGLPFLSGVTASAGDDDDDARALRLDLATAFKRGPSVRLSCRPNDAANRFSLVLKCGAGPFGSPLRTPVAISAEFNLFSAGARAGLASFSLLLKPRLGDFAVKKTVRSSTSVSTVATPSTPTKTAPAGCGDGQILVNGSETLNVELRSDNGAGADRQLNGFPLDTNAVGAGRGGETHKRLPPGFEVTTRSVVPLRSRAIVSCRWGMRAPTELRNEFDGCTVAFSLSKLPLLVMNKISVEHLADDRKVKNKMVDVTKSDVTDAYGTVTLQLEELQTENCMLRKVTEELRSEVDKWRFNSPSSERPTVKGSTKVPDSMAEKIHSRERSQEGSQRRKQPEEVNEELKKALIISPSWQRV